MSRRFIVQTDAVRRLWVFGGRNPSSHGRRAQFGPVGLPGDRLAGRPNVCRRPLTKQC